VSGMRASPLRRFRKGWDHQRNHEMDTDRGHRILPGRDNAVRQRSARWLWWAIVAGTMVTFLLIAFTTESAEKASRIAWRLPFRRTRQFRDAAHGFVLVEAVLERG
jgi:hypothetical protein